MNIWDAPASTSPINATVRVPGSKSLTNRYLLLAALAKGPSVIRHPLVSRDTTLMVGALEQLGVAVNRTEDDSAWHVTPPSKFTGDITIECGLAGTVMRFVPPIAALARGQVRFDGDASARTRPMSELLTGLRDLGVMIDDEGEARLPFSLHATGSVKGGRVAIDASASSQFISALLLAGARFEDGLTVRHTGDSVPSSAHIQMTLETLRNAGVQVSRPDDHSWRVWPGAVLPFDVEVEPDLSSAAPFVALAAVTGGTVTVEGWPQSTTQAGAEIAAIAREMGAEVSLTDNGLVVTGPPVGELLGLDRDLHEVGELTPVVAAMAAVASGPSTLRGVAHLRGHETDRLAALQAELGRMGSEIEQTADGLTIEPRWLGPALLQTYHDHRMAMAAAVLGAVVPGTRVEDVETTAKTFPGFEHVWAQAVG
ncbi:3-phosphoshikimate 1-carboxyvinyltransferase [Ornithinimicrobium sp. Arc0846-15]|nr:3-phosphoshikimate 1-carboxyvinyltransferase [Ornithinimicrobium laminariae]